MVTVRTADSVPPCVGSLAGTIAVVIGGGTSPDGLGNGSAICISYARAGAMVLVVDLELAAAKRTTEMIVGEGNVAHALMADVTDTGSLASLAKRIEHEFGEIGVLHNNVGITRMGGPPDLPEDQWRLVMDTNLTGVFLSCSALLPAMIRAGAGVIINTSSIAAIMHTGYDYSAYYAAKAGLNHLTRTMAVDLAPKGIRVNAVMPGMIQTPLIFREIAAGYESNEQMLAHRSRSVPMGRMGSVWDVAAASVFLAGGNANYITGVCLPVDGGLSLR